MSKCSDLEFVTHFSFADQAQNEVK